MRTMLPRMASDRRKNSYPGWEELGSPRSPFRNSIHPRNGNTPLLPTAKLGPDDTRASSKWVYPLRIEEALSTRKTLSSDSSSGKEMRRQHRQRPNCFGVGGVTGDTDADGKLRFLPVIREELADRRATSVARTAGVSGKTRANSSPPYLAAVSIERQQRRSTLAKRQSARLPV